MKKILSLLLVVCITFSLFGCGESKKQGEATQQVQESEQPQEQLPENPATDFEYSAGSDSVVIKGYVGNSKLVVIPNKLENIPVMGVYSRAFQKKDIEKVVMPSDMNTIFYYAFAECTSLKEVVFNEELMYINEGAFSGCTAITEIDLPYYMKEIGDFAFKGCTSLEKVYINKILQSVSQNAFELCTIKELVFKDEIESIDIHKYFLYATQIENVVIPASVKTIKENLFNDNLKSVTFLGDAPKEVVEQAFGANAVIYYKKGTNGWDTTSLRNEYTLIEK